MPCNPNDIMMENPINLASVAPSSRAVIPPTTVATPPTTVATPPTTVATPPTTVATPPTTVATPPSPTVTTQQELPVQFTLDVGTPIKVITSSEISTKESKTGDEITMVLNENITNDGRIIARRGSTVKGVVSDSDQGGRIRGLATLSLTLDSLTLVDGGEIYVKTSEHNVEARSTVAKDVTRTGVATGIGAAIGAIAGGARGAAIGAGAGAAAGTGVALATYGDPAVIARETEITFNLISPLTVTLK